ncbi:CcdB family protein [Wenzhouxiangella sp. EGI_FJ10409]|uniref:CcdB family protein n=1 Tax=Wenzhouxiangella sp. EGI_FJ10409 TaxID=3243767 RepID=UPI0035E31DE9
MARFDVYRNAGGAGYLLDVQSDLLQGLNTRVVVPLLPPEEAPQPARRLNPVLKVERTQVVMTTQFLAAVADSELGQAITRLEQDRDEITAALDMLFIGF